MIQLNQEQVSSDFSRERNATVTVKFPEYRTYLYKNTSRKGGTSYEGYERL